MDAGGRICARGVDLSSKFQAAGAHPWVLDRRRGPARGIGGRLAALREGRLSEDQWRSAYQLVFGRNPAGRVGWEDKDDDMAFTQNTSLYENLRSEGSSARWRKKPP